MAASRSERRPDPVSDGGLKLWRAGKSKPGQQCLEPGVAPDRRHQRVDKEVRHERIGTVICGLEAPAAGTGAGRLEGTGVCRVRGILFGTENMAAEWRAFRR